MVDHGFVRTIGIGVIVVAGIATAACSDLRPTAPPSTGRALVPLATITRTAEPNEAAPPTPLVTLALDDVPLTFWPYTGDDFTGIPKDPINAVFSGYAEPLRIRAALRRLDGNRTAFGLPPVAPFNCTWKDAIGDEQTAFGEPEQWTGSAVQLACRDYTPVRFHVRLFAQGASTLANAHMDLHIIGTTSTR